MPPLHVAPRPDPKLFIIGAGAILLLLVAAGLLIAQLFRSAPALESAEKFTPTIVVVKNPPALDTVWTAAEARLAEFGYTEGIVHFEIISIGENLAATKERLRPLIQDGKAALIYTMGIIATRAAKEVTQEEGLSTPVVFAVVSNPVAGGLVMGLESSGNNLTGYTPANDLAASKRLEYLKEMLPETKRIIYAWNDETTSGVVLLRRIAPALGFELIEQKVESLAEMVRFFENFEYRTGDAVLRASDGIGAGSVPSLVATTRAQKVPLIGTNSGDTRQGALMSFGADYANIGVRSAEMVVSILEGMMPSEIPIEEASHFEVAINTDTAAAIGVKIPEAFLLKVNTLYPAE